MSFALHITPGRALDADGNPYSGALWYFYESGTDTLQTVYADSALTTPLSNPVVADAGGKFPNIYLNTSLSYRSVCKNSSGSVTLWDIDPVEDSAAPSGGGGGGAAGAYLKNDLLDVAITGLDSVAFVRDEGQEGMYFPKETTSLDSALVAADTGEFKYLESTATPGYHWVRASDDWPLVDQFARDLDATNPWHYDVILQRALDFSGNERVPVKIRGHKKLRYPVLFPSYATLIGEGNGALLENDLALPSTYAATTTQATAAATTLSGAEKTAIIANRPAGAPSLCYNDPNFGWCAMFLGDFHPYMMPLATGSGVGTAHVNAVKKMNWQACTATSQGTCEIIPTSLTPFAAGDLVVIREKGWNSFSWATPVGQVEFADFASTFVVVSVGASSLILDRPIPIALTEPYICNTNDFIETADPVTGYDWQICRSPVIDGLSIKSPREKGIPIFRTGFHDARIYTPILEGLEGVSCNFGNWSTWDVDTLLCSNKGVELACNGYGTRIHIGNLMYRYALKESGGYPIQIGEQARGYHVEVDNFIAKGGNSNLSCVYTWSGDGKLVVNNGTVSGTWNTIVSYPLWTSHASDPYQSTLGVTQDITWKASVEDGTVFNKYLYQVGNNSGSEGFSLFRNNHIKMYCGPAKSVLSDITIYGYRNTYDLVFDNNNLVDFDWVGGNKVVEASITITGKGRIEDYDNLFTLDSLSDPHPMIVKCEINGVAYQSSSDYENIDGGGGVAVITIDPKTFPSGYRSFIVYNASGVNIVDPSGAIGIGSKFRVDVINQTGALISVDTNAAAGRFLKDGGDFSANTVFYLAADQTGGIEFEQIRSTAGIKFNINTIYGPG